MHEDITRSGNLYYAINPEPTFDAVGYAEKYRCDLAQKSAFY